ncbi:hypothetical protein CROQUDRAFT_654628 [Cronartium quercuum f. sp. fusiforme G11]|uniref:F-box protein Hrt3/FBXO9 C-terminal domain-containing protein n=1 Tax=Cronartium quercuum f. sp. fusiforme G11 TaxID=708437 RepID=A0A9P6TEA6_9BASI|nr:hypothetical protein CROQUDRAFT_654628 [Cronartium quercuum f. sp. fusiforme G11]
MNPPSPSSSSLNDITQSTQHLLDSFRQEWFNEVNQRSRGPTNPNNTLNPTSSAHSNNPSSLSQPGPSHLPVPPPQENHTHAAPLVRAHLIDQSSCPVAWPSQDTSIQEAHQPVYSYAQAVYYERLGLLDDALQWYRKAFKADPSVDRLYHRLDPQELETLEKLFDGSTQPKSDRPVITQSSESTQRSESDSKAKDRLSCSTDTAFKFSRPMQAGNDYRMGGSVQTHTLNPALFNKVPIHSHDFHIDQTFKKTHRTCGKDTHKTLDESDESFDRHPSSTKRFRRVLLDSFQANPWVRPPPIMSDETQELLEDAESKHDGSTQIPSEISKESNDEPGSDDTIIKKVSSPTLDPESFPTDYQNLNTKSNWIPDFEPLDLTQASPLRLLPSELILHIFKSSLELRTSKSVHSQVILIEQFARVSRFSRMLMLEDQIWKEVCENTYERKFKNEDQIHSKDLIHDICHRWHGGDWRRMYIEEPRIRYDGCFICLVRYPRSGESANPWYPPTLFVTYFRYLRFFPDGTCLNFSTTDDPSTVVRTFDKSLRSKGLSIGKWDLVGDLINIWDLEERAIPLSHPRIRDHLPAPPPSHFQLTYKLQMRCRLKSTQRGKMNKLEILNIATINKQTNEVIQVPLTHSKPFFFSRVLTYEALTDLTS